MPIHGVLTRKFNLPEVQLEPHGQPHHRQSGVLQVRPFDAGPGPDKAAGLIRNPRIAALARLDKEGQQKLGDVAQITTLNSEFRLSCREKASKLNDAIARKF